VIGPRLKLWAGLILAGLVFFLTFGKVKLQQGRLAERADEAEATVKAIERGARGAAQAQRELQNGKTPDEIRRANDARWD
jgi:hypothetical protein